MSIQQMQKYEFKKGKEHPQWKGGRNKASNGYIWIYNPEHPLANKTSPKGYILEHRLVMCESLGRMLIKGEVVHHINGKRDDNRIENLVLTTNKEHVAEHNHNRIWKESSKEKHRIKASKLDRDSNGKFKTNNKQL